MCVQMWNKIPYDWKYPEIKKYIGFEKKQEFELVLFFLVGCVRANKQFF